MPIRDPIYLKIIQIIHENPNIGSFELCEKTGLSFRTITKYIKNGTLIISNQPEGGASKFFSCEKCGRAIRSGRLCARCESQSAPRVPGRAPEAPEPEKNAAPSDSEAEPGKKSAGYHSQLNIKKNPRRNL
ncbi:MAG: winged helix-turn-helix domain-containing protein [Clostridiales bacterium]|jgi:hypothetical protein|nr:winged helix-turn-helix domain-containing protein [Clostridiales bacterium]